MSEVIHQDLALFLIGWYRSAVAERPEAYCSDVVFDRVEPSPGEPFPARLVVVSDDGGSVGRILTSSRSIRLSVLAGSKEDPSDALSLAAMLVALRTRIPGIEDGNPVTSVGATNGPYLIAEEQPHARVYVSIIFGVAGVPL